MSGIKPEVAEWYQDWREERMDDNGFLERASRGVKHLLNWVETRNKKQGERICQKVECNENH